MIQFVLNRIGLTVLTFFGVTILAFALIRLAPGDPILLTMGERGMDPVRYAQVKAEMGLDKPIIQQYWIYLSELLRGNFGRSVITRESVWVEFTHAFPATIELSIMATLLALVIGLPAGILAGTRRGTAADYSVMIVALTGYSMPIFWWGLLLILTFSVGLGWTPVSGRIGILFYIEPVTGFLLVDTLLAGDWKAFWSALRHLILPAVALGTIPLAVIARMTRSAMLEVLSDDYIRTARAKGLSPGRVVWVHALRNALIPVITVIGLEFGHMLAGAILTETIFSWPGIGKWLIESVRRRDYPALQGGVLLAACVVIAVNLFVDLLYGLVNPRIRHSR